MGDAATSPIDSKSGTVPSSTRGALEKVLPVSLRHPIYQSRGDFQRSCEIIWMGRKSVRCYGSDEAKIFRTTQRVRLSGEGGLSMNKRGNLKERP